MSSLSEMVRKYRATIDAQQEKIESLRVELTLTRNQLDNATAKLHGTRQHVTEINQGE